MGIPRLGRSTEVGVEAASAPLDFAAPSAVLRSAVRGRLLRQARVTPRELEVFECLADGQDTRRIAEQLCVSSRTVEDYVHALCIKTGAAGRTELVALWLRLTYRAIDALLLPSGRQSTEADTLVAFAGTTEKDPCVPRRRAEGTTSTLRPSCTAEHVGKPGLGT